MLWAKSRDQRCSCSLAREMLTSRVISNRWYKTTVSTQLVESNLEAGNGFHAYLREVAQATPVHSQKAHIYLDSEQRIAVTIPLMSLRSLEAEFYRFGRNGKETKQELMDQASGARLTKRLTLIEPTEARSHGIEYHRARSPDRKIYSGSL